MTVQMEEFDRQAIRDYVDADRRLAKQIDELIARRHGALVQSAPASERASLFDQFTREIEQLRVQRQVMRIHYGAGGDLDGG